MCNMNKINRMISKYNYTPGNSSRIKYIVIHYVGALGGAKENCIYYGGRDRGSSAHYFVGFDGEIWQCVEDQNIAWHCGASSYKHPEHRHLGQRTGTGISKIRRCSQLLSWSGI